MTAPGVRRHLRAGAGEDRADRAAGARADADGRGAADWIGRRSRRSWSRARWRSAWRSAWRFARWSPAPNSPDSWPATRWGCRTRAIVDPQSGVRNNLLSALYANIAMVTFLLMNGHHAFLRALRDVLRVAADRRRPHRRLAAGRGHRRCSAWSSRSALRLAAPLVLRARDRRDRAGADRARPRRR